MSEAIERIELNGVVLPARWKRIMLDRGGVGDSKIGLMANLGITADKFDRLVRDSEEFREIYERCKVSSYAYWELIGRELCQGQHPSGKGDVWKFIMINRFGWRDKVVLAGDSEHPLQSLIGTATITKEELLAKMKERGLPMEIFTH